MKPLSVSIEIKFINSLTPRVKPWVIQSFPPFDTVDRRVTICQEAVKQYFTVVLFVNPLTPRVKQSFLTFDSMDRTLKCDHSLENC